MKSRNFSNSRVTRLGLAVLAMVAWTAMGQLARVGAEESPGVALARALGAAGYGVQIYDPLALASAASALEGIALPAASIAELLERSDVVVIATPWPGFADLPIDAMRRNGRRTVVIDCWRLLSDETYADTIDIVRLGQALASSRV
jgi:UDP-N-acetyl-D-mannosaminuronate dehydrogenase